MLVLGIDTSCDETACAVVEDAEQILSSKISSSINFHRQFGGVIPEAASRQHLEFIISVLDVCLKESGVGPKDLDLISVTRGPGLVGALLVGINLAKALSFSLGIPLLGINHLTAHLYASFMAPEKPNLPAVGLVVSGGHTELVFIREFNDIEIIGRTRDDACGEAFDKVARILNLGYPGGPIVDRLAREGEKGKIRFSCGEFRNSLDFSFSGIKTAVLYYVNKRAVSGERLAVSEVNGICAGFQEAVVDTLVKNALSACRLKRASQLVLGGGVSANSLLRERMLALSKTENIQIFLPPLELCLDNAATVAGLGYHLYRLKQPHSDLSLEAEPLLGFITT
jgi:N6-L-threonylcarbamoyladenine synthase